MTETRYAADEYPLKGLTVGADFSKAFTYKPEGVEGTGQDWTGYTAKAQLRPSANSATVLLEFDVALGDEGSIELAASHADTAKLRSRSAVWDLKITAPGGKEEVLMAGTAHIAPAVTR